VKSVSHVSPNSHSGWNLYWASSDGEEDCFIVARNSRSAQRVDAEYCGFERGDVYATRVKAIPKGILNHWEKRREKDGHRHTLPWYADDWLLRHLGATFREREHLSETLIDDVVYTNSPDGPVRPRIIGRRYLTEFRAVKAFQRYGHVDHYSESQMALFTILGICMTRVQEIEHLMAHSFVFGAIVESERRKNMTIEQLIKSWKRKTLGQMLRAIELNWDIEPTVHAGLQQFLEMRNQIVHGLTTSDQYDIRTSWGQDETIGILTLFELISRPLSEAFQASLYASIDIGNKHLLKNEPKKQYPLTVRQRKKIGLFAAFFSPKQQTE
jgi:uncharacterized protein YlbG (UPF0298 family)